LSLSSYKNVPLQIVGQTYEHRSEAFSVQKTMNLIPQSELTGAAESSLTSWPGCIPFATVSGNNRGMTQTMLREKISAKLEYSQWNVGS
jgi:hypothetical protein